MLKPKILIYGNVYETTVGQGIAYMKYFSHFGDVSIVTTEMNLERCIAEADILALPGGMDMFSGWYGARPGFDSRHLNHHFEYLDQNLLKPWLATGKPIIAICRGMQVLNVALGGTLHPHVNGHQQADKYDRDDRPNDMYTDMGEGLEIYPINSYHHQAVKEVAEGFEVLGWSDVFKYCPSLKKSKFKAVGYDKIKGVVKKNSKATAMIPEIMRHKTLPYIAFQYHPEEFMCPLAIHLTEKLIEKYNEQANQKASSKEASTITSSQKTS